MPFNGEVHAMQRIFVVGCPRSGTTLIQAMLARHPAIFTLPETAFFERLLGTLAWRWGDQNALPPRRHLRDKLCHRLGLARRRGRRALRHLQRCHGRRPSLLPRRIATCVRHFAGMLDALAERDGCTTWIEKTPNHLLYIAEIEHYLPDARFIHVIRPGEDVLASIADANLAFGNPRSFGGGTVHWSRRWNRAAQIHRSHAGRPHHHFIFLQDLIDDVDGEWLRLCRFLDIAADCNLADNPGQAIADLASEPWKHAAVNGMPRSPRSKVKSLFGPQMRHWLREQLTPYDDLRNACLRPHVHGDGEVRDLIGQSPLP